MEGRPAQLSESDRTALMGFLVALERMLGRLLRRNPPLLPDRVVELLDEAWNEIEREGRFELSRRMVEIRDYDTGLTDHGLYGSQLAAKLIIFERAKAAVDDDERRYVRSSKRRRGLRASALKAANVVLGSLSSAIPGVSAIKELKDATEAALDEKLPLRKRIIASIKRPREREAEPLTLQGE